MAPPDDLLLAATDQTGLTDFGDDSFREGLDILLRALRDEARLNARGEAFIRQRLIGHLAQRLQVEDWYRRHPEIDDVEVRAPIIIIGLPRTGTTHLHNLMSADPGLRSLPYWEAIEPIPPLAEQRDRYDDPHAEPRYQRCVEQLAGLNATLPYFKRMHDMYPDHVHEEIDLLAIGGSTMSFETMAPMGGWVDYYRSTDQRPYYRYCKRVLAALQWMRGPRRWVLKSPQHLEQIPVLLDVFPDATLVVTYRDPVSVTASFATMITYSARMSAEPFSAPWLGQFWARRIQDMLEACLADRDRIPEGQVVDCLFHEFMADDVAMVERIYELADQPFTPGVRAAMDGFMAEHPRGKHGRVRYDIGDFGVDADERRAALAFYVDRFGVEPE